MKRLSKDLASSMVSGGQHHSVLAELLQSGTEPASGPVIALISSGTGEPARQVEGGRVRAFAWVLLEPAAPGCGQSWPKDNSSR